MSSATTGAEAGIRKRAVAIAAGNFMEWFDFAVYGFFAVIIGEQFFGSKTPVVAVLSSLAVFAVGFVMRPLGGFILGPIGDRYGRRTALTISILGMGIPTAIIGFLPNYAAIGVAAPLLLVLMRCLQGLSAGGELTGSTSLLIESAPDHRRAFYGSFISMTAALATLVGSFVALLLNAGLSDAALASWGWRIPFWCAIPLVTVGFVIRLRLSETAVFAEVRKRRESEENRLARTAKRSVKPLLLTIALASVEGLGFYYLNTYVVNYLQITIEMTPVSALMLTSLGIFLYVLMCPVVGILSDRIGRRTLNLVGTIGFVVLTIPCFLLLSTGNLALIIVGLVIFGMCLSLTNVTTFVMIVELFPASTRMSGSSIGFGLGLGLVAGPGPYIGALLASTFGNPIAPAAYMIFVALVALIVLFVWLPESRGQDISSEDVAARVRRSPQRVEAPQGSAAPNGSAL